MKKILFSTILALAATGTMTLTTSCEDQLDIEQKGVIPTENFYKTDADAEAALVAAYEGFMCNVMGRNHDGGGPGTYTPLKLILNECGDDVLAAGANSGDNTFGIMLNQFYYDAEAEVPKFMYTGLYLSVYTCNLVLDHFADATTAVQKRCAAEARVLRAYDYFLLANLWGTPPLVTHVLDASAQPVNCDKDPEHPMDHKQLIEWIAQECENAANDLDERKSKDDKDGAVKVTKGFAYALAGKAYLFAGQYDKAKTALKKVIDSGKYDLVPGEKYADNFHIEGDANEEKVFEVNFEYNAGKIDWAGMIQRSSWMETNYWDWRADHFVASPNKVYCGGVDGWGGLGVPQWFGDEFYANDGDSYRLKATLKHIDDAVYHMSYGKDEIDNMTDEQKKTSDKIGINDPLQGLYGNSTWLAFKQIMRASDTDGKKYGDNIRLNNYLVMRYAEVLLNYAEACLQTGDQAEAKKYINMIQKRAGSKTISETVDMDVLKKEKSYELWLEGCRWFDIMRWNDTKAIDRLTKAGTVVPHLFDKVFRAPKADDQDVTWEYGSEANSRFYTTNTPETNFKVGFKKGKHEFFPYPQTVLDKNPNLQQNPGW
jgi:tetratricopeptide (TPR) repeat protein